MNDPETGIQIGRCIALHNTWPLCLPQNRCFFNGKKQLKIWSERASIQSFEGVRTWNWSLCSVESIALQSELKISDFRQVWENVTMPYFLVSPQSYISCYFRSVNHEVVGRCPAPAWNSGQGRGWGRGRRRSPVWGWHHLQGSHRVMLWMTTKQGLWSLKYVKDWLLTVYFAAPRGEELHLRGLWVEVWSNCVQEDPWKSPGVDLLHPGWQGGREVEHWEVQQVDEYFCVNVIYICIYS